MLVSDSKRLRDEIIDLHSEIRKEKKGNEDEDER